MVGVPDDRQVAYRPPVRPGVQSDDIHAGRSEVGPRRSRACEPLQPIPLWTNVGSFERHCSSASSSLGSSIPSSKGS